MSASGSGISFLKVKRYNSKKASLLFYACCHLVKVEDEVTLRNPFSADDADEGDGLFRIDEHIGVCGAGTQRR